MRILRGMHAEPLHSWHVTAEEAVALQRQLRERVILQPPADLQVRRPAGLDVSFDRDDVRGYGGIVVLEQPGLQPVAESLVVQDLGFPYVPGLLSFRELPLLAAAWERLELRPDVLVFDGQGIAHPRRFGIACHGGLLFGVPSIGCAKSLLVGTHGRLAPERGAVAEIVHRGEVIGVALRTRTGVTPVYVSPGHLMDLPTAVQIVLSLCPRYREPETTRQAHRRVNELRREQGGR